MNKNIVLLLIVLLLLISCNSNDNFKEKYIKYNEHSIYYEIYGNSPKTIILIHGWTGNIQNWKYQTKAFPEYKVIAIDLPGNGKSSKIENVDYTMEIFADSVYKVLEKEKISKSFFIGHSMGLSVCEVIAQKYPEKCIGICSMDGAHFEISDDEKAVKEWIEYNRIFANTMNNESGREAFLEALFMPDSPMLLKEEVFAGSRKVPLSIGKAMIEGVEKDQKYWRKKTINKPFLAIYSPAYQLPVDYKNELSKTFPIIEYYYIPDVSHFLMMEMPYKVNQLIIDFLKKYY